MSLSPCFRAAFLSVALLTSVVACSSSTTPSAAPAGTAAGDGGSAAPLDTIAKKELGGDCSFGCEPGVACAASDSSCPLGQCAFDGRPDSTPAAYCTAECSDNCPEGYSCETVAHSSVRVCLAKPGKCGDGEIQGQERCDDGNTKDFDACSKDCMHDAPVFHGDVRYGSSRSRGRIDGPLPLAAQANGCNQASVVEANGELEIQATFCDAKTSERMQMRLAVKNARGPATLHESDIELRSGAIGTSPSTDETLTASCYDCGVALTVEDVWGSATGFSATIGASLSAPSDPNHVKIRFEGAIQIAPPSASSE